MCRHEISIAGRRDHFEGAGVRHSMWASRICWEKGGHEEANSWGTDECADYMAAECDSAQHTACGNQHHLPLLAHLQVGRATITSIIAFQGLSLIFTASEGTAASCPQLTLVSQTLTPSAIVH